MNYQDREMLADWLDLACAESILPVRDTFVDTEQTMCPLAALYKEACGEIPWQFNEMNDPEVMDDLGTATGIDFRSPFLGFSSLYSFFIHANDTVGLCFEQIISLLLGEDR